MSLLSEIIGMESEAQPTETVGFVVYIWCIIGGIILISLLALHSKLYISLRGDII